MLAQSKYAQKIIRNSSLNIEAMCQVQGLVHAYFVSRENVLIGCNNTQYNLFTEVLNKKEPLNSPLIEIMGFDSKDVVEILENENQLVTETKTPQQYHNLWVADKNFFIELSTIKFPVYDIYGNVLGTFGYSQYMSKFSVAKSYELGLSKRQTECLYHLTMGLSTKQIAQLLDIMPRTVEKHIDSLKLKLDCNSQMSLVLKAIETNIDSGLRFKLKKQMQYVLSKRGAKYSYCSSQMIV